MVPPVKRVLLLVVVVFVAIPSAALAKAPVLDSHHLPGAIGFGHAQPRTVYLGGDPSGVVCRIRWVTWGRSLAVGIGVAENPTPDVAHGYWTPAVIIASGLHHGRYHGLTWTLPMWSTHSAPCHI